VKLYRLGNEIADGIESIEGAEGTNAGTIKGKTIMYNLNGQAINRPTPRSIYIKNGKKYISY
jgi:hypothetical protein